MSKNRTDDTPDLSSHRAFDPAGIALVLLLLVVGSSSAFAGDCNGNGVPDDVDIVRGTSPDCDTDGLPDECAAQVSFTAHSIEDGGGRTVVVGDLDADGDLDVVSGYLNAIAWNENLDGSGSFGPARIIDAGADEIASVFTSDLDGDGDLDVLAGSESNAPGALTWYENLDGAGTFGVGTVIDSTRPTAVIAADVDGDGDEDVMASKTLGDRAILWYENTDGAGTFAVGKPVASDAELVESLVAVDVDGDGDLDVVSGDIYLIQVAWHENLDGAGTFGPARILDTVISPYSVSAADLDSDNDVDVLAVENSTDTVVWYENLDGAGSFSGRRVIAGAIDNVAVVSPADLDGDGDADVVAASFGADQILWYENLDGGGNFAPAQIVATAIGGPRFLVVADIDRDGSLDVVCALLIAEEVAWYENLSLDCDSNGLPDTCELDSGTASDCNLNNVLDACDITTTKSRDCNETGIPDECELANGTSPDVDADGVPDECQPDCNGNGVPDSLDVELGSSADCNANLMPDECEPDCNGNAIVDECDVTRGTSVDCNLNSVPDECEPDCNLNSTVDECDIQTGVSVDCNSNGIPDECDVTGASQDCDDNGIPDECQADCNGNGVDDACDIASQFSVDCDGNGVPDDCDTVLEFPMHSIDTGIDAWDGIAADLDGDSDVDIVTASLTLSSVAEIAWFENEDAVFGPKHVISVNGDAPVHLVANDFDGDGDLDLAVASHESFATGNRVEIFENLDGQGNMGSPLILPSPASLSIDLSAADFDGDGDSDLLLSTYGAQGGIVWHENLGQLHFSSDRPVGSLNSPDATVAVDVDSDGDPDVVSVSFTDDVVMWYENANGQFAAHTLAGVNQPRTVAAADVDGDGDADILVGTTDSMALVYENTDGAGDFALQQTVSGGTAEAMATGDVDGDGDADVVVSLGFPTELVWLENVAGMLVNPRILEDDWARSIFVTDLDGDLDLDIGVMASSGVWWHQNQSDDCNGNRIPDTCEDCDGSGGADTCELAAGISLDCNANAIPDTCDTKCTVSCDADGDLCLDDVDVDPLNPSVCGDSDGDSCEDCASGQFDPRSDGLDTDGDGSCDVGDCATDNALIWGDPGPASSLIMTQTVDTASLSWQPPQHPGAVLVRYDTLRSPTRSDFESAATCLAADETDPFAVDGDSPASGTVFYYLVRVENDCPGSVGSMGASSAGVPRSGPSCP